MKSPIKAALLAASLVLITKPIFAAEGGLFVEPMITYESSSSSIDYPAPFSNSTGSVNGAGIGVRLGGHVMDAIFLAADVRYSKPQFKDSTNNLDAASTSMNYGAVVGFQMPMLGLRVWGGYVFGGELSPEESNGVEFKFSDPKGYRVGAGIHVLMVSINLEYQALKYDKTTLETLGGFSANTNLDSSKLTNNSYVASVSFPISF